MAEVTGLENLANMDYPGSVIILGRAATGYPFAVYILTGKHESGKAQTLEQDKRNRVIYTKPTNRKKLEQGSPVLLLYPAIMPLKDGLAISNGAQTKLIYSHCINQDHAWISPKGSLVQSLDKPFFEYDKQLGLINITSYEPDSNKTPRISGCIGNDIKLRYGLSISKPSGKEYFHSPKEIPPGFGEMIATYDGMDTNDKSLQAFKGNPLEVRLKGKSPYAIANEVRTAIKDEYFIALACQIPLQGPGHTHIIND